MNNCQINQFWQGNDSWRQAILLSAKIVTWSWVLGLHGMLLRQSCIWWHPKLWVEEQYLGRNAQVKVRLLVSMSFGLYYTLSHSGFGANLDQFSSKHKIYFFQSEWSLMVILRIIEVNNSLKPYPAPLSQELCMPFWFLYFAMPVWNHSTQ